MNPTILTDHYKIFHAEEYPENTQYIYSNFTPRASRTGFPYIVFFGLQYFLKEYMVRWEKEFFNIPKEEAVRRYARIIRSTTGQSNTARLEQLHDIGYLPIKIEAAPEGSKIPIRCPALVITNTRPEAFWLVNYLETILSASLWFPCTSATLAHQYKLTLKHWSDKTCDNDEHIKYQAHDFSFRGMTSLESSCTSGAAHLLSFVGTDTIPAVEFLEKYYNSNCEEELIGCSVPASEHSTMTASILSEYKNITSVEEEFDEITEEWKIIKYL